MVPLNLAVRNYLRSLNALRGDSKDASIHRASPIALTEYDLTSVWDLALQKEIVCKF